MTVEDDARDLEARREKAKEMGGAERVAKQHARGRLTARERVDKLLDPGSFLELGILARADIPELEELTAADGRICGAGTINGRRVGVVAHDRTVLGGSGSSIGHQKDRMQQALAVQGGYPFINLADESGGIRIQNVMGSKEWSGQGGGARGGGTPEDLEPDTRKIPHIVAIMGECFGEPSWNAATADYVAMVKGTAMGAAGPKMIEPAIGQKITAQELCGWEIQSKITGQAHSIAENDEDCLEIIKEFLSYMPPNCNEEPPYVPSQDDPYRRLDQKAIAKLVPTELNRSYDMFRLIRMIVDDGKYFVLKKEFAPAMVTCLARVGGRVVGIYANNPMFNAGAPDVPACEKAAEFICFCDSFNIPIICLLDIPGMFPGRDAEKLKLPTKIMVWAQAQNLATVPRINIVIRKDYAMGGNVMLSHKETNITVAWPSARMAFVDPEIGMSLAGESRIAEAADPEAERQRILEEWATQAAPWGAASVYGLHDVIDPRDTRKFIVQALEQIRGNRDKVISKHRMQFWPTGL